MKSHEQKMHVKKEHEVELERNDLNAWAQKTWTSLKSGQIASKRFAIMAVVIGVVIGLAIYLIKGGRANETAAWKNLDTATSMDAYDEIAKNPNTLPGKVARLQKARLLLGPQGVAQMSNPTNPELRNKALKCIEEAREIFTKLADEFKDDLTLTAESIHGAAQAELALVGVPREGAPEGSTDFRGSVDKAIELFRRYAKVAGDTAGEPAKKMADELEAKKSDAVQLGKYLSEKLTPQPKREIKIPDSLKPEPAPPSEAPKK